MENCHIDILKQNNCVSQNYQKHVEIEEALAMTLRMVSYSA